MFLWAKQTRSQVLKNEVLESTEQFLICNYYWIFDTHQKAKMLQIYNKVCWQQQRDLFLLLSFWDQSVNAEHYELQI